MEIPQPEGASADQHEGVELRVRALSPAESLAVRAGFLVDGERPAAALPLLAEALRLDPTETSVLETLGRFHFQQNSPIEAAGWFDRAIESGSASHLAYFYRAILAVPVPDRVAGDGSDRSAGRGESEEVVLVRAEDHLQRAIDLNPGFAPAYVRLADLYAQHASRVTKLRKPSSEERSCEPREASLLEEALPLMRRATELEPDNAAHWVDLGRLLLRLHRLEEAREAGRQGLAVVRAASSRELVEAFLRELEGGHLVR
jgi:tetratricopeptide (TPR) repeat protein